MITIALATTTLDDSAGTLVFTRLPIGVPFSNPRFDASSTHFLRLSLSAVHCISKSGILTRGSRRDDVAAWCAKNWYAGFDVV